jgi:hypothetical protein
VVEVVHQLDIQHTLNLGVEHSIPIGTLALLRRGEIRGIPVGEHVTRAVGANERLVGGSGTGDLRRGARIRVGDLSLLRSGRTRSRATTLTRARGCSGRRGRSVACNIAERSNTLANWTSNLHLSKHTVHSSTRLISSREALRGLRRTRLSGRGRLLKGMLGRLLILGGGRGKTGTTTSLVGHDTTKQVAGAMAQ